MNLNAGFGFAISTLLGAALCALASPAVGQTWQIDYDPAVGTLPSPPSFTHFVVDPLPDDGLDETNYLVALGVLAQGDTGGPNADPGNTQWYEVSSPSFDFDEDVIVFDMRLKIISSTLTPPLNPTPSAGFGVVVVDGAGDAVTLFIGSTGAFLSGWGPTSILASFDSTIGYADYQLRIDRYGASIRVDGAEVATLERDDFDSSVGPSSAYFGDVSSSEQSSSQLQSVRLSRFNPPAAEVRNYGTLTLFSVTDSSSTKSLTVSCPPPTKALGGGASTIGADGSVGLTDSRPSGGPPTTSWTGGARELVDTSETWQLRVDVICGEVSGYENLLSASAQTTDPGHFAALDCSNGKVVIGGGAGIVGAGLRQTLTTNSVFVPFTESAFDWGAGAWDYGAVTSSSPWGVEVDAICSDAISLEPMAIESAQEASSPKQLTLLCPSGKVPVSGGARVKGWAGGDAALRFSRPLDGAPGSPPVGWIAGAQVDTAPFWSLEVTLYCAPISDPTVSKTGLVGRWKGDNAADDSWDIGHGTLENGVGLAPDFLGQGQAFSFDGVSDQWVRVPSRIPVSNFSTGFGPKYYLYPKASFSVDAWIQTDTLTGQTAIVNLYDSGGTEPANPSSWSLRLTDTGAALGAVRDDFGGSSTLVGPSGADLADGLPHHLVFMRDMEARRVRLYVDGILEGSETVNSNINDGPLVPGNPFSPDPVAIGIWRDAGTTYSQAFTGLIDDVKYYDRALSAEEIENIAGCGVPLVPRVLNLDASRFGSPADEEHRLCVLLEAGDYSATLVNPALDPDARLTAWSPSPTDSWSTVYVIEPEIDPGTVGGFAAGSSSPQQAFDDTVVKTANFTLTADQRVHFSVVDDEVLDNRGGVSVLVQPVPEPSPTLMLVAGVVLLGFLSRPARRDVVLEQGPPRRR